MVETLQPASGNSDGANIAQGQKANVTKVDEGISINDVRDMMDKVGPAMGSDGMIAGKGELRKIFEVTDEDRKEAIQTLGDKIPPITDPKVAENLQAAQAALINGDSKALAAAFAAYKDDPEMMKRFVAQLDADLKDAGAGTRMTLDKAGNVVIWGKGDVAMEVNPKDGSTTLRKIEHNMDGSITLKDGEVVGDDPAKVAKRIGDDAARNINRPPFIYFEPVPHKPWKELENGLQHGGKGGGGAKGPVGSSDGTDPGTDAGEQIVIPNPFTQGPR